VFAFYFYLFFNNLKWGIFVSCLTGGDKRFCTAVFCKKNEGCMHAG